MTRKALYKHKQSGDIFAIETDDQGNVVSTSGSLLVKDLNPNELDEDLQDYDEWQIWQK